MRRIARLQKPVAKAVAVAGPAELAVVRAAASPACRTFHSHSRSRSRTSASSTSSTAAHSSTHTPRRTAATLQLYRPSPPSGLACRFLTTETANRTEDKTEDSIDLTEAEFDAAAEAQNAVHLSAAVAQSEPVLIVPGETETAPRPTEIADSNYQPATSADGLETVGGIDGWWEDDAHWDNAVELRGFAPRRPVTDPAVLQVLARRAVLEAVAVQQLAREGLAQAWGRGGAEEQSKALALEVDVAADGSVTGLRGDAAAVVESLRVTEALSRPDGTAATLTGEEAQGLLASWDSSWKRISLADPLFKFSVIKRVFQLTGHMMPDAQLALADNVAGLLAVLVRPPKAKKLAEELAQDGELAGLPNVAVYGRRVTPIDRHKMVGRWKVIVEELEKRSLPVTGTGGYSKAVERKWAFH